MKGDIYRRSDGCFYIEIDNSDYLLIYFSIYNGNWFLRLMEEISPDSNLINDDPSALKKLKEALDKALECVAETLTRTLENFALA